MPLAEISFTSAEFVQKLAQDAVAFETGLTGLLLARTQQAGDTVQVVINGYGQKAEMAAVAQTMQAQWRWLLARNFAGFELVRERSDIMVASYTRIVAWAAFRRTIVGILILWGVDQCLSSVGFFQSAILAHT